MPSIIGRAALDSSFRARAPPPAARFSLLPTNLNLQHPLERLLELLWRVVRSGRYLLADPLDQLPANAGLALLRIVRSKVHEADSPACRRPCWCRMLAGRTPAGDIGTDG